MDINTIGVATVAAIIVICYLIGMIVKATALDSKWIPIICGVCGGIIGALALAFHMPDFKQRRGGNVNGRDEGLLIPGYAQGEPLCISPPGRETVL